MRLLFYLEVKYAKGNYNVVLEILRHAQSHVLNGLLLFPNIGNINKYHYYTDLFSGGQKIFFQAFKTPMLISINTGGWNARLRKRG